MIPVHLPYPQLRDIDGSLLESGYIYIGVSGKNPEENPILVYWNETRFPPTSQGVGGNPYSSVRVDASFGKLSPVTQPIRTSRGVIVREGVPSNVYIFETRYSLTVKNQSGLVLLTVPDVEFFMDHAEGILSADSIGFRQEGSTVSRTVEQKLYEEVTVTDFGADPTGVMDSTRAFNLATKADMVHHGNSDLSMRRKVVIPPGDYLIAGTVYVRKGQMLIGSGDGVTRITAGLPSNTGRATFKMGFGIPSNILTEDPGGLPVVVCNIHTYGGDTTGPVVDMQVSGAQCRDMFITSCGIGVRVGGSDTILSNCIIDQGLMGISLSGQNHIISNNLFYSMNYGINVGISNDIQINNCHFEYGRYSDIIFQEGSNGSQNISIGNCQFITNVQYGTIEHSIHIRANSIDLQVHDCSFRNQENYCIASPTGLGGRIRISDCVFNGLRTNSVYSQSTTTAGILTGNNNVDIVNCTFTKLFSSPITMNSSYVFTTNIEGCSYSELSNVTSFVNIVGTNGSVQLSNCIGDNVTPIVNLQNPVKVFLRRNTFWLGQKQTEGSRDYWKIPTQGATMLRIGLKGNTNNEGNNLYEKASLVIAIRYIDYSGTTLSDYITMTTPYSSPSSGYVPALGIDVELDSVGGGIESTYAGQGRYVCVSLPTTYTNTTITADIEI